MILITGEGRSGTTLLVQFLAQLGFNTRGGHEWLREEGRAKIEGTNPDIPWPEVIKHFGFITELKYWVTTHNWNVEHVFYIMNDMETSINKRLGLYRIVENPRKVYGDPLLYKKPKEEQEKIVKDNLYTRLGQAAYGAIELGIPFTVIHYQSFCKDVNYACRVLSPIFDIQKDVENVHKSLIDLEKVKIYPKE